MKLVFIYLFFYKCMNVSIITVVRNAEKTIEKTIQSVINQTYDDYEYIIIDGCSTDTTNRIIETYLNHISKYISEPDAGIYDAMNKGISLANGKWIYFWGRMILFIVMIF